PTSSKSASIFGACSTIDAPEGANSSLTRAVSGCRTIPTQETVVPRAARAILDARPNFAAGSRIEIRHRNSDRGPGTPRHDVYDSLRRQLLPSPQRHDAVAAVGAVPEPQGHAGIELCPGRADHGDVSAHGLDVAAARRALQRQAADTV